MKKFTDITQGDELTEEELNFFCKEIDDDVARGWYTLADEMYKVIDQNGVCWQFDTLDSIFENTTTYMAVRRYVIDDCLRM